MLDRCDALVHVGEPVARPWRQRRVRLRVVIEHVFELVLMSLLMLRALTLAVVVVLHGRIVELLIGALRV